MPSLAQGFDDFHGRCAENIGYSQMQSQKGPDYLVGSNSVSHYPDPDHAPNSQHFEQYLAYPSLPPIREMRDRRECVVGSQSNHGNWTAPCYPSENLGHFPISTFDVGHGAHASTRADDQNRRTHAPYSAGGSARLTPAGDLTRYDQHSSIYGGTGYSTQALTGPQQPNFGILGDSNDPRKRRRGNLPKHATDDLKTWFGEHIDHPYPTEEEKQMLMKMTGLSMSQV